MADSPWDCILCEDGSAYASISIPAELSLCLPTVSKAAELMGIREDDVRKMLAQKRGYESLWDTLSRDEVEFLADKYVARMKRYFRNSFSHVLSAEDFTDFVSLCDLYSKTGGFAFDWEAIEYDRMREDFISSLLEGTIYDFSDMCRSYVVRDSHNDERLSRIVRSYFYHMKAGKVRKTGSGLGKLLIEIILTNHFHIFSSESDSSDKTLNKKTGTLMFNNPEGACPTPLAA